MRSLVIFVTVFLLGCSNQSKITYIEVSEDTPSSEVARIYNTMSAIKIVSIDNKKYSKGTFEFLNDEAIYISPGLHSISIKYCLCSAEGSTYIEGVHTFTEVFIADHDYGLVFNYAPTTGHELWLSHAFTDEKGRKRKKLLSTLGPFELKKSKIIYVPLN